MTKYNQIFKQQVVDFYFEYNENLPETLRYFSLAERTVRHWIAKFNYSGTNGLAVLHTKRAYSPKFKSILENRCTWFDNSRNLTNGGNFITFIVYRNLPQNKLTTATLSTDGVEWTISFSRFK